VFRTDNPFLPPALFRDLTSPPLSNPWQGCQPLGHDAHGPITLSLSASRVGASAASLCQCLTTLLSKEFPPHILCKFPLLYFKTIPLCLITIRQCKKSFSLVFISYLLVLEGCHEVFRELLQSEQTQLPQPFFTGDVLQPSGHLSGPPLDPLQQLPVFFCAGGPMPGCSCAHGVSLPRAEQKRTVSSLSLLAAPLLMQPRM